MDWLSSSSRPHSTLPQLGRSAHATEFIPRVLSSSASASASPNFLNSFPSTSNVTPFNPLSKRLIPDDNEMVLPPRVTPESQSPPSQSMTASPVLQDRLGNGPVAAYQENVGGTTYFYQYTHPENNLEITPSEPLVNSTPPNPNSNNDYSTVPTKPEQSHFMSEELRNDIIHRNMLTLLQPDPEQYPDLPLEVDSYHELFPLEPITNQALHKAHLGYPTSMYKATHMKTGLHCCLRRIHGFRLQNTKCMAQVEKWKQLSHSSIVQSFCDKRCKQWYCACLVCSTGGCTTEEPHRSDKAPCFQNRVVGMDNISN